MPCVKSSLKKYRERESPAFPANDPGCRNKVKSRYGKRWKSIPNKKGIFRWVEVGKIRSRSIGKRKKVEKKAERGTRIIVHCEPYTWHRDNQTLPKEKPLKITSKLYETIKRKPAIYRNDRGNGYRFGPQLPLSSYKKVSEHVNMGAQTGLVDPSMFKGDKKGVIGAIFEKNNFNWEDRKALKKVRKVYPGVLFIGETDGGDGGAALYAHKNKKGVIDSIIIDNERFFPSSDEE